MTEDLRHGKRKRRCDTGKRKFDIVPGTDTFEAASFVIGGKLDPDDALRTAIANGHTDVPTLATMQRLLNEKGLNRKRRNSGRRSHRRFEAASPLDLIQIDCTALKIRWQDIKTRRILRIEGIDKNHPQMDAEKIRVWQIMAVDDHSRRRFLRYVVAHHITSMDMVHFASDLFCAWGIPLSVYTDNGPEFKKFFAKMGRVLEAIPVIRDTGGYRHFTHAPGNAQASGKVENAHKWAEKMDRYVGLAIERGIDVTFDNLNGFADNICRYYNEVRVHRETGKTPIARWFGTRVTTRMLPAEFIRAATLFDEAERILTDTWTVRVGKVDYRIPSRDAEGNASPFRVGMKLTVIVSLELDLLFVTTPNGEEYEIAKQIATADAAGEFRTLADSEAERLSKELKKHYTAENKAAKDLRKSTGEAFQVPFLNHDIQDAKPASNVIGIGAFKHPEQVVTPGDIAEATPVPMDAVASSAETVETSSTPRTAPAYTGKPINFWDALDNYRDRFASIAEAREVLEQLFPDQQGTALIADVEALIERHVNPQQEVAPLRLAG